MGSVSFRRLFGTYTLADYTHAVCASPDIDPDLFYSEETSKQRVAIRVCGHCPLGPNGTNACLYKALDMERELADKPQGVWGGMTAQERIELNPRSYKSEGDTWDDVLWGYDLFEGDE